MAGSPMSTRATRALNFGVRFESDDPLLVEVLERCYRDLPDAVGEVGTIRAQAEASGERFQVTYEDRRGRVHECEDSVTLGGVLDVITWEVNERAMSSRADRPTLHAAVTAGPLGAVLLCGQSRSGKSTLSAAAARRGWRHLSDDLAPVDVTTMSVEPYARPLMLRIGGREVLADVPEPPAAHLRYFDEDRYFPASELGAVRVEQPVPIVGVVLLGWADDAALGPISRAETLFGLASSSLRLGRRGAAEFAELEAIAVAVPGHRLALGEPDRALDLLAPLVGEA